MPVLFGHLGKALVAGTGLLVLRERHLQPSFGKYFAMNAIMADLSASI